MMQPEHQDFELSAIEHHNNNQHYLIQTGDAIGLGLYVSSQSGSVIYSHADIVIARRVWQHIPQQWIPGSPDTTF